MTKKVVFPGVVAVALALVFGAYSNASALVDLNVNGGAKTQTNASSSSSGSNVNVNGGASVNSNASSSTSGSSSNSSTSGEANGGFMLNISRSEMKSDTSARADMNAEAVLTQNDLQTYAETAIRGDESVEEINFTDDQVEVRYKQNGRFLALLPVNFTVKATAKADGDVDLDYPWYAFLTLDKHDELETNLKVAIDNTLRARTVGSVSAEGEAENPVFTASESAEIAARMQAVLKAGLESESSVRGE